MDLNEMEQLWKDHDKKLEYSIKLNEKLLKKLNLETAVDEFSKLLKLSILGRNLALVYFLISTGLALAVIVELKFSLPGLVGGLFMLLSFIYHLSPTSKLKKLNFYSMPVIELQKKINEFKIRSISVGKYDFAVVAIWFVTVIPLYMRVVFNKDLYLGLQSSFYYWIIALIITLLVFPLNSWMYSKLYGKKLTRAEAQLDEIIEFEKTNNDRNG